MAAEPDDREDLEDEPAEEPSLRQKLHWATGDRDAEARALADQAGDDVDADDAYVAVKRAHGELRDEEPVTDTELATVEDARAAAADDDD